MPIINYKNVDIHIDSKIILEGVTFTLNEGEFVYLVGAVGSGKSSLIKTLYGEVAVHGGDAVLFDKYDMRKIRRSKLQQLRKQIGIVFQDFQLLTDRNVHDNLDFVLRCTGWKKKKERESRIIEVLELVELASKGYKMPHELSGGEQQRVVIARAILNHPKLLLADEPTGNLDNETGHKIMKLLHRICKEEGTAVLMITHNEQWLTAYPAFEFRCAGGRLSIDKGGIQTTVAESTAVEVTAPIAPAVEAAVAVAAVAEPAPAAVIEPAPAAVAEPASAAVVEPAPAAVVEPAPAAVVEPAVAAVVEPAVAAVVEPAPAAVAEPIDDNDIQTADC
ncbi:MAG: ATP-binding cassette domain-containing protein [Bacteroidaceae bacterium]|nr:ATP-binding cassette domain-containing protein [Bacteroidaceae bacterium]